MLVLLALAGCRANYRVELWNDTGHAVDVGIVEQRSTLIRADRRATVAPGGWFDYTMKDGERWPRRLVRVKVHDADASVDLDMTERQMFRGRVLWNGSEATIEPITLKECQARRGKI